MSACSSEKFDLGMGVNLTFLLQSTLIIVSLKFLLERFNDRGSSFWSAS